MWTYYLLFGIISAYADMIPYDTDYVGVSLSFQPYPNPVNVNTKQSAVSFGSCKIVYSTTCPDPDIQFFLYTRNSPQKAVLIATGREPFSSNLPQTDFDPSKPTKIIIHGYNSDMNLTALVEVRKEYLRNNDFNVFIVDWSPLNQSPCYFGALFNMRLVGKCSAQLVERIREFGATDIHVIGFSLGAHVTNYLAINLRPYLLPRITGLDPALPGFITPNLDEKLDRTDAQFVDVYHTNSLMQGKAEESGHVDFYINGGILQPGCWAENRFFACNHHRAPLYFAESINTQIGFWGWPCSSFLQYLLGRCPPTDPQIVMGEKVDRSASGVYLVITESVSPFAVGKYEGPNVEILLKLDEHRKNSLRKYKKEVEFSSEDDLIETMYDQNKLMQKLIFYNILDNNYRISGKGIELESVIGLPIK